MATQVTALRTMLEAESVQKQFHNALKENKDAFIASVIDLYSGDAALQRCEPKSVLQEALKAAVLKLPINKALGFSYIVVYNNSKRDINGQWVKVPTPTFLVGYRGLIQMAMRTGQYKTINADAVYKGELRGADKLTGRIDLSGERESDEVVGYFAHFELLNGFTKTLYMSVREMAAYAKKFSPSVKRETTIDQLLNKANAPEAGKAVGWEGDFTAMALKTVIRRLLGKYGYLSVEMQGAMENEAKVETAATDAREVMIQTTGNTSIDLDAPAEYVEIKEPTPIAAQSTTTYSAPSAAPQAAPQPQPQEVQQATNEAMMFADAPDY